MVMVSHGFVHPEMLVNNNFRWPVYFEYVGSGFLSVLVFFCISGYVIGLNYDRPNLSIKDYLKKRAVRLYPIYIVSIIVCLIVTGGVSFYILAGNLLFLQNLAPYGTVNIPVYLNYVTWSLNSEVVYYLLFIAVFFARPRVWVLLLMLITGSLLLMHAGHQYEFASGYVNGFYFWMAGLIIVWTAANNNSHEHAPVHLLSLLFLHLCQSYLGIGTIALHIIHIYKIDGINWLFDLPFCVMVICTLTGKDNTLLRINKIYCYALPAVLFTYLIINQRLFETARWEMCVLYWVLALIFYFEKRLSTFLENKLLYIGQISYALYLFHVPVAYLVKQFVVINNTQAEVPVKYALWVLITFTLSILMELKVQPVIKRYLFSKNPPCAQTS